MNRNTWYTKGYLDDFAFDVSILLGFPQAWTWHDTRQEKMVGQNPLRLWDVYMATEEQEGLLLPANEGPQFYEYI